MKQHHVSLGSTLFLLFSVSTVFGQFEEYLVIANGSVPCEMYDPTMSMLGQSEPYHLTDNDKMQLFAALGGHINSGMQAVTEDDAKRNFINLLPITSPEQATLRKYLKSGNLNLKKNVKLALETYYRVKENIASQKASVGKLVTPEETMSFSLPMETVKYGPIEEGTVDERLDYCLARGTELGFYQNYLRLCTVCVVTRYMTDSFWPRYINQARCQDKDPVCLINDKNEPQGRCDDARITMNILRRQEGMCILALSNGQMIVAEDWEIAHDLTSAGCECAVSKDSFLARYA